MDLDQTTWKLFVGLYVTASDKPRNFLLSKILHTHETLRKAVHCVVDEPGLSIKCNNAMEYNNFLTD